MLGDGSSSPRTLQQFRIQRCSFLDPLSTLWYNYCCSKRGGVEGNAKSAASIFEPLCITLAITRYTLIPFPQDVLIALTKQFQNAHMDPCIHSSTNARRSSFQASALPPNTLLSNVAQVPHGLSKQASNHDVIRLSRQKDLHLPGISYYLSSLGGQVRKNSASPSLAIPLSHCISFSKSFYHKHPITDIWHFYCCCHRCEACCLIDRPLPASSFSPRQLGVFSTS